LEGKKMGDVNLIQHLCNLSKLTLQTKELERFTSDMEVIIGIMDSIKEVSVEGDIYRDPGVYFADVRKDESAPSYPTEQILGNAKEKVDNYFEVPKVF
jgi:aspartyl/glutamyl-tRNA(Asn/Gln) amidotransferase C subunit